MEVDQICGVCCYNNPYKESQSKELSVRLFVPSQHSELIGSYFAWKLLIGARVIVGLCTLLNTPVPADVPTMSTFLIS